MFGHDSLLILLIAWGITAIVLSFLGRKSGRKLRLACWYLAVVLFCGSVLFYPKLVSVILWGPPVIVAALARLAEGIGPSLRKSGSE